MPHSIYITSVLYQSQNIEFKVKSHTRPANGVITITLYGHDDDEYQTRCDHFVLLDLLHDL